MMDQAIIATAIAPVYKKVGFTSEMVTQGLMFELVIILSKEDNWFNVKMEDGYEGWMHHFYLSQNQVNSQNSLTITNRCTPVHSQWGIDRQIMTLLSFGTVVPLIKKTSGYCKIQMINGEDGFISSQTDVIFQNRDEIIRMARVLIGAPYLWGGKSSFGYDCSGFVQMVLKAVGISIPRDTDLQLQFDGLKEISMSDTEPGDLVFFSEDNCINHVAFATGTGKIIHCSGEVKLESIKEGEPGFNHNLAKLDHTFKSISKMLTL